MVLVAAHDDDGAVGVVLNRPTETTVAEAVPPLSSLVGPDDPLYLGGPVQPGSPVLLAEFADPDRPDVPVMGAIGFVTDEMAEDAVSTIRRARVFAGHAGWGPGQLEGELADDGWIIEPALPDDVFADPAVDLWRTVVGRKGPAFRLLQTMPYDPSLN